MNNGLSRPVGFTGQICTNVKKKLMKICVFMNFMILQVQRERERVTVHLHKMQHVARLFH